MDGAIVGSVLRQRLFERSRDLWTSLGFRNTSVDAHQTITRRSSLVSLLELANVVAKLFGEVEFVLAFFDVRAVEAA